MIRIQSFVFGVLCRTRVENSVQAPQKIQGTSSSTLHTTKYQETDLFKFQLQSNVLCELPDAFILGHC